MLESFVRKRDEAPLPIVIGFRFNNRATCAWLLRLVVKTAVATAGSYLIRWAGIACVRQQFTFAFLDLSLFVNITIGDGWKARMTITVILESIRFITNRWFRWDANFPAKSFPLTNFCPTPKRFFHRSLDLKFAQRQIVFIIVLLFLFDGTQTRRFVVVPIAVTSLVLRCNTIMTGLERTARIIRRCRRWRVSISIIQWLLGTCTCVLRIDPSFTNERKNLLQSHEHIPLLHHEASVFCSNLLASPVNLHPMN